MLHYILSFGVAQGILEKKTVFDHTCAVFDAGKLLQKLLETRAGVKTPAESHQQAPQRKPPDATILDTFATSERFVKKRVMITPFRFCLLALGPLGTVRSLRKTPTFEPATATGHHGPAKPVLLLGNDPKLFCEFFLIFYDLQSAAYFVRFSKILASIQVFPMEQASKFQRSFGKSSNVLVSLKDPSKKQGSQLLSCRGGLGEAPYNTPRHSLQRCRSKALWDRMIRK